MKLMENVLNFLALIYIRKLINLVITTYELSLEPNITISKDFKVQISGFQPG